MERFRRLVAKLMTSLLYLSGVARARRATPTLKMFFILFFLGEKCSRRALAKLRIFLKFLRYAEVLDGGGNTNDLLVYSGVEISKLMEATVMISLNFSDVESSRRTEITLSIIMFAFICRDIEEGGGNTNNFLAFFRCGEIQEGGSNKN